MSAFDTSHQPLPHRNNRVVALGLVGIAALMVGAAYAAVPLYQLFCQVTGYAGTTQVADANPKGVIDREMTVRFDANVSPGLPWRVTAAPKVTDRIGAVETIVYIAENLSDRPITGVAGFNVVPERVGAYFNKIECFCFTEQTLQPGERVEMPVTFFVDPDIDRVDELRTVRDLTLSYTFYASDKEGI